MKKHLVGLLSIMIIAIVSYYFIHIVSAGTVSDFSINMSRHKAKEFADYEISFTISSSFDSDETMILEFADDYDLNNLAFGGIENTGALEPYDSIDFLVDSVSKNLADSPGSGDGSAIGVAVVNRQIIFTQNDTNSFAADSDIVIKIGHNAAGGQTNAQIMNPSSSGIYLIELKGDFGDLDSIEVPIIANDSFYFEAEVSPEISFSLKSEDHTQDVTTCDLGQFGPNEETSCAYYVVASTNAGQGFEVYIEAPAPGGATAGFCHTSQTSECFPDAATISSGTNAYGLGVEAGNDINEEGDFATDDTIIPADQTLLISSDSVYNYDETDLASKQSSSTKITHKISTAAVPGLPDGDYDQVIIYSIIGKF